MKGKKIILLCLALLLPVCVFLFLKMFGKNEFDVPALYQTELPEISANCNVEYTFPYVIADSSMNLISTGKRSPLYLLNFGVSETVLARIKAETRDEDICFVEASHIPVSSANQIFLKDCVLILKSPNDIVLIDDQKRIRGYYQSTDLEEMDRLILEVKIILKHY